MTYLDQTGAIDDVRLAPPNWTGFAPRELQAAGEAWRARATQERRSAAVFATISSGFATLELPLSVLAAVARIVADEVRHTAICRRLAAELGADAPDDDLGAAERRLRPPHTDVTETAVSLLLVEGALGETISAAMFAATRAVAREPRTRSALSIILRNEVRHARTCWEILAVLPAAARLDPERLARDVSHELGVVEMASVLRRSGASRPATSVRRRTRRWDCSHRSSAPRSSTPSSSGRSFADCGGWVSTVRAPGQRDTGPQRRYVVRRLSAIARSPAPSPHLLAGLGVRHETAPN